MEEIIQQIIDIEKKAQELVKAAEEQKEHFSENMGKDIDRLRREIAERVKAKDAKISELEEQYAEEKIEALKQQYAQAEQKLLEKAAENKDAWIEHIYNAVISGC